MTIDFSAGQVWDGTCANAGTVVSSHPHRFVLDFPGCGKFSGTCDLSNGTMVCSGTQVAYSDGRSIERKYWLARFPTH
ncbi:MAG: hypothetical protein ACHQHM_00925 [Thermoanaerobaculales bacterium]